MKILAMYLPQFHRIPENDVWWGAGFTDWVSAQNAVSLYNGHYQPHVPLGNNYYDLSEKSTMEWQTELMKQYGVDGMCIYHYWFKDGRRILEKPAENLLQWKDIAMPFCFCWANESWARSWSKYKNANAWINETQADENGKQGNGMLLEQSYGTEKQWKEHFDYLLPFFLDERYIRVDEKPVIVIYKSADVTCLKDMLDYWKQLAMDAGLRGIYVIGAQCNMQSRFVVDGELLHEPGYSCRKFENVGNPRVIDYESLWEQLLKSKGVGKTYYGGFVGYDDTPRRGQNGMVIQGTNSQSFEKFFTQLIRKNKICGNELVFVNAWNEWGEGMHLEPDEKYGYAFLEAVKNAKKLAQDGDFIISAEVDDGDQMQLISRADKFENYLNLLDSWMTLRENKVSIADSLIKKGIT
ncbi:MAG: glycoside hydrolase family 99-like domain-containing protein, partial [Lachnospiraceae bacterium]|nr:glycoside hydrolase family 99-like domain-containing protein [Lachnospiraceae bacterium]